MRFACLVLLIEILANNFIWNAETCKIFSVKFKVMSCFTSDGERLVAINKSVKFESLDIKWNLKTRVNFGCSNTSK